MKLLGFKNKILMLVTLPLLLVVLLLVFLSIYQTQFLGGKTSESFSNLMLELKRSELKNYTEVSLTTVKDVYLKNNLGLSESYQDAAESISSNIDYVGDEFFFVYDYKSVIADLESSIADIEKELVGNIVKTFLYISISVVLIAIGMAIIVGRLVISESKLADENLKRLSLKSIEIQEQERGRIAKELQSLVKKILIHMRLKVKSMLNNAVAGDDVLHKHLHVFFLALDKAVKEINRISGELRPEVLDKLGLYSAVAKLVDDTQQEQDVKISFHSPANDRRFDANAEALLYRVFQEAIQNIVIHSHSASASIKINESSSYLKIAIQDKGSGFDVEKAYKANARGILDMKIRVESLDGHFSIFSSENMGTLIRISVPV